MNYIYIPSRGHLSEYIDILLNEDTIAIDTETTGLDVFTCKLRLLQIASYNLPTLVIDMFNISKQDNDLLQKLLKRNTLKIFQNAKFDLKFLNYNGFKVNGYLFDTMLAGKLLRSSNGPYRVNLKELVNFFLGKLLPKEEQTSDFSGELREKQLEYAAKDAFILLELKSIMQSELEKADLLEIANIEFKCIYALVDIEITGIKLDLEKLLIYSTEISKKIVLYKKQLSTFIKNNVVQQTFFGPPPVASINFNSNKQVLKLLNENNINVADTSHGSLSKYSEKPIVIALKSYRKSSKLYNSFLASLPKHICENTKRIHASYMQMGASSGRMSCSNPNMQQIPRDNNFRKLFIPETGNCFIIADYSQIELRVAAELTKDPRMILAYKNNEDLHKLTASIITSTPMEQVTKKQRQSAKAVNFGLIFGMGSNGLKAYSQDTYNITISLEQADTFRYQYFKTYTGIKKWHDKIKRNPPTSARSITNRRYFYSLNTGFSSFLNTPVQGSAADLLKNALGDLALELKDTPTHIVAVIHDEIILECPIAKADYVKNQLKRVMENSNNKFLKHVKLVADVKIASNWAEK